MRASMGEVRNRYVSTKGKALTPILFSVVIPAFNAEAYIETALLSLQRQTYPHWEAFVVDDGSTDGTFSIVQSFSKADARVKAIHQENAGPFAARRAAYAHLNGDYILHLDADDAFRSDSLERLDCALENRRWDLVLFEYSRDEYFNKPEYRFPFGASREFEQCDMGRLLNLSFTSDCLNSLWSKCIKKSLLITPEYPDDMTHMVSGEDRLQSLFVLDFATDTLYLRENLYFYRVNERSTTFSFRESDLDDSICLCRHLNNFVRSWQERSGFIFSSTTVEILLLERAYRSIQAAVRYASAIDALTISERIRNNDDCLKAWATTKFGAELRWDMRLVLCLVFRGHESAAVRLLSLFNSKRVW